MANFAATHGMIKGKKQKINKETGPKKDIISMAEWERQVVDSVPIDHKENLDKLITEYWDIFLEKLPKGVPTSWEVQTSYWNRPWK